MNAEVIHRYLQKVAAEGAAVIEQAVEQALQGGEHGVSTRRVFDGVGNKIVIEAWVDPTVPYGQILDRGDEHI